LIILAPTERQRFDNDLDCRWY